MGAQIEAKPDGSAGAAGRAGTHDHARADEPLADRVKRLEYELNQSRQWGAEQHRHLDLLYRSQHAAENAKGWKAFAIGLFFCVLGALIAFFTQRYFQLAQEQADVRSLETQERNIAAESRLKLAESRIRLAELLPKAMEPKRSAIRDFGDKFPGAVYRAYLYRHRLMWLNESAEGGPKAGLTLGSKTREQILAEYHDSVVPQYVNGANISALIAAARVEFPSAPALNELHRMCMELVEARTSDEAREALPRINALYSTAYEQMLRAASAHETALMRSFGMEVPGSPAAANPAAARSTVPASPPERGRDASASTDLNQTTQEPSR